MPPKCRKSSRHAALPKTRGRPKRRFLDRNAAYHRRRLSDSQWRAEMSSSFNTLRCLVLPSSSVRNRRQKCRRAVLQAAVQRLRYLEGLVSELLANDAECRAKPRNIRAVRSQFRRNLETGVSSLTRRKRCRSEQSSQELPPSLEMLEECDQEEFTGVREAGGASNRADAAAISEPSSPTICQVWWSNRAVEAAIMSSPTVKRLMESFYDDAPLPTNGLNSAQIVPDEVVLLEACPPSDPEDEHLVPVSMLGSDFDSSNHAASSEVIVSEDPLLSSAIVRSANSPEKLNDVPNWSAEQVIIGSEVEWDFDAHF